MYLQGNDQCTLYSTYFIHYIRDNWIHVHDLHLILIKVNSVHFILYEVSKLGQFMHYKNAK